jgi:CheY-like chemotaxis protein
MSDRVKKIANAFAPIRDQRFHMQNTKPTLAAADKFALIVDDDSFIHDYFSEILSALGISNVHSAHDGRMGLRTLTELPRTPDFLICDVFMPDMDGFEFLGELAKRKYQGGIILVSGLDITLMAMAQQIALDNGLKIWGAFCKPVSLVTLSTALTAHGISV